MYALYTTEDILTEVLYHLRRDHSTWDGGKIMHLRTLITECMDETLSEYKGSILYPFTDINDRHVHAAAVAGKASMLVTADHGFLDGPDPSSTDDLPYEILSPDDFFVLSDDSAPDLVRAVTREQATYAALKHRVSLPEALRSAGCPQFAERVAKHLRELALE
jgi:predicted nucleic acid-binding protein